MSKQYFIHLYDCKFEVEKKDYMDFYKQKRRVKYLREADESHGLVSYQANDGNDFSGEDYLVDAGQESIEEIAIRNVMIEHLRKAMKQLTTDELFLINALFFERKSERELSKTEGIPLMTLNNRKRRILSKLKILLEI